MKGREREKACTKAEARAAKTRKEKEGKTERQMVTDIKNSTKTPTCTVWVRTRTN
jgi:chaperonin GroEL (HSP60 family)